jgi:hypothetical protein
LQNFLLLVDVTTNGPGDGFCIPAELSKRSFVVSLTGPGTVSATVDYMVSNDNGVTWAPRLTIPMAGVNHAESSDVDMQSPFSMVCGKVSDLSPGAKLSFSMCAA